MPGGPETVTTTGVASSTQRSYARQRRDELGVAPDEGRQRARIAPQAEPDDHGDAARERLELEAPAREVGRARVGEEPAGARPRARAPTAWSTTSPAERVRSTRIRPGRDADARARAPPASSPSSSARAPSSP